MKMDGKIMIVGGYLIIYLILFFIFFSFRKKLYGNQYEYDERQERVRGIAYRMGFYTLLFGIVMNAFVKELLDIDWATPMTECAIFLCIAIFVVCTICITGNAYFSPFAKRKNIILISAIIGAINLFTGINRLFTKQSLDELHRFSNIQLVIGIVLLGIPVFAIVHELIEERGDVE